MNTYQALSTSGSERGDLLRRLLVALSASQPKSMPGVQVRASISNLIPLEISVVDDTVKRLSGFLAIGLMALLPLGWGSGGPEMAKVTGQALPLTASPYPRAP